jgi:hypothetical protein
MNGIRRWLFAKLWLLTMWVAPTEVRIVAQRSVDIGMTEMEKEMKDERRNNTQAVPDRN